MISIKQQLIKDFGFNPFEGSIIFERPFIISLVLIIFVVAFKSLNIQIALVNELVNALGIGSAIVMSFYLSSRFYRIILMPFQILFVLLYIVEITLWGRK